MKCRYLRGVPWTMSSETLKSHSFVRKFSIKLLGGLFFPSTFDRRGGGGVLKREGGQRNVSTGARFLQDGLVATGRYTTFSNNKKMVINLHRELEHKVEKVLHMKLEVMRPKTKNNMNYQP